MNGKPDSGSINTTSKVPGVSGPNSDTGHLPTRATGSAIPSVSGDSSGKPHKSACSVPPVAGGKEGSPNNGANQAYTASGPERMNITR